MSIDVACAGCGRTYRIPDDKAGRKLRCRQCDGVILVPSASDSEVDDLAGSEEEQFGEPVLPGRVRPSSRARGPKNTAPSGAGGPVTARSAKVRGEKASRKIAGLPIWGWIVVMASVGSLTIVVLCLGVVLWFGREPPPVLSDDALRPEVDRAVAELQAKSAAVVALVDLQNSTWLLDQTAGTLSFDSNKGIHAVAPVQIIGTFNTADGTWLWAWDNPSVDKRLTRDSAALREYGRKHNIAPLLTRKLKCEEVDCWEFAALACKLCQAQGAYRGPAGATRVFMTFGKITMSKKPAK